MMLAQPWYLLGLLALPLLWWLSQPPKPRRQEFTAHLAQWQEALRALRRRPPRGSLWRFVLLALATIAVTLAAARPFLPGTPGAERLVVLLDASASMAAVDDAGETAFDVARQRVRQLFADVPDHIEVTLLRCGGELLRRHGASARALHDVGAPAGPLRVDLVELAAVTHDARTAVCTITDGQGQAQLPAVGALQVLDRRAPNAAIRDVRLVDAWPLPTLQLEVDVVLFAPQPAEVLLTAAGAIAPRDLPARTLVPGQVVTVPLALERLPAGGRLELRVRHAGDRLPADDTFSVVLPPLPAPRIAVLSEDDGGPFAAVAASALAAEVGGKVVPVESGGQAGLLLVDGGVAEIAPGEVRALTFGTRLQVDQAGEPLASPGVPEWSRTSDLTRGLDLSELRIDGAWRDLLPAGEPFLWADDGDGRVPLAVSVGDDLRSIHFAFRLQDSNLPLLAAFPQLLRRAFVHSYGQASALARPTRPAVRDELDLQSAATGVDRGLPEFAGQAVDLGRWCVVIGLLALALRSFVR